ncbi:MAG TPA: nickel pincer cofactor biosynthesis protein LarC [Terriglobales bacterium]|nr:nickel pincer cofactor biosynthesis protein LarC [Terriglobales bacterium]
MRIAYLDCFSGISGDMFLGALLDAGIPAALFEETVRALDLEAELKIGRVSRSGVHATKVDVYAYGEKDLPREQYWEQGRRGHAHHHEPGHEPGDPHHQPPAAGELREHAHAHAGSGSAVSALAARSGRGLEEIRRIIAKAKLAESAKSTAIKIFEALGAAEAKIHQVAIDQVHFHEVGAVDAMVDIVCAAVGAGALAVDELLSSPLNLGSGTTRCAHGTFPVPAPATLELLRGVPVYSSGVEAELVTPTGAAIVKTLVRRFLPFPAMKVDKIGYGAGTRDLQDQPNVCRIAIGDVPSDEVAQPAEETIAVLEANLDDLNPQIFGYAMDRLLAEGALDVFGTTVQMKKNRPGMQLTVLCRPEDASRLSHLLFRETTTLGVRQRKEKREVVARRWATVKTQWGDVRIKVASSNGAVTNYAPEYEDCRGIAVQHKVPLKHVIEAALQEYLQSGNRNR